MFVFKLASSNSNFACVRPCDQTSLFFVVATDLDPAFVVPKDSEMMLRGEELTATCNALSSLPTSTVWYKVYIKLKACWLLLEESSLFKSL